MTSQVSSTDVGRLFAVNQATAPVRRPVDYTTVAGQRVAHCEEEEENVEIGGARGGHRKKSFFRSRKSSQKSSAAGATRAATQRRRPTTGGLLARLFACGGSRRGADREEMMEGSILPEDKPVTSDRRVTRDESLTTTRSCNQATRSSRATASEDEQQQQQCSSNIVPYDEFNSVVRRQFAPSSLESTEDSSTPTEVEDPHLQNEVKPPTIPERKKIELAESNSTGRRTISESDFSGSYRSILKKENKEFVTFKDHAPPLYPRLRTSRRSKRSQKRVSFGGSTISLPENPHRPIEQALNDENRDTLRDDSSSLLRVDSLVMPVLDRPMRKYQGVRRSSNAYRSDGNIAVRLVLSATPYNSLTNIDHSQQRPSATSFPSNITLFEPKDKLSKLKKSCVSLDQPNNDNTFSRIKMIARKRDLDNDFLSGVEVRGENRVTTKMRITEERKNGRKRHVVDVATNPITESHFPHEQTMASVEEKNTEWIVKRRRSDGCHYITRKSNDAASQCKSVEPISDALAAKTRRDWSNDLLPNLAVEVREEDRDTTKMCTTEERRNEERRERRKNRRASNYELHKERREENGDEQKRARSVGDVSTMGQKKNRLVVRRERDWSEYEMLAIF